jgi:hypothetical protein
MELVMSVIFPKSVHKWVDARIDSYCKKQPRAEEARQHVNDNVIRRTAFVFTGEVERGTCKALLKYNIRVIGYNCSLMASVAFSVCALALTVFGGLPIGSLSMVGLSLLAARLMDENQTCDKHLSSRALKVALKVGAGDGDLYCDFGVFKRFVCLA